jgi:HAD superfamily hydrolase (TIGR01509 family)
MTAAPQALFLDAGNTLVFLDHSALSEVAAREGLAVSASALQEAEPLAKRRYETAMVAGVSHERGWALHMESLYECAGLTPEEAARATVAARAEHDRFNLWRDVPAGLPAHLTRARGQGLRLGVISNSEGRLMALFERVGLNGLFEVVIDSALVGVRKPDPAIFALGLDALHITAGEAVYAGDIPEVDVAGARAAGLAAVLIDSRDHYPSYVEAPRFASVAALLASWGIP